MKEVQGLSFLTQCEDCKQGFEVNPQILMNREFQLQNKRSICLTYYDCPKCGRRHIVQVDDTKSKQMLVGVSITFGKFAAMRQKGKAIPKKQSDKFQKARQNLSDYRMALMKELTGEWITDPETGCGFELRFSV